MKSPANQELISLLTGNPRDWKWHRSTPRSEPYVACSNSQLSGASFPPLRNSNSCGGSDTGNESLHSKKKLGILQRHRLCWHPLPCSSPILECDQMSAIA